MRYNEPAFPIIWPNGDKREDCPGMTIRDWFAGMALIGKEILRNDSEAFPSAQNNYLAANYYKMADAMLAERDKEK